MAVRAAAVCPGLHRGLGVGINTRRLQHDLIRRVRDAADLASRIAVDDPLQKPNWSALGDDREIAVIAALATVEADGNEPAILTCL